MNALVTNAENLITLSVIRSLGKKGIDVTGASDKPKALCFSSKYCRDKVLYPPVLKEKNEFLSSLERIVRKGSYDVMFPTWIDVLTAVSERRDRFSGYTKIPLPAHESLLKACDKAETLRFALENDIPCPKTYFPESLADVVNIKKVLEYPAVIKPRKSFGARGLYYVSNEDELVKRFIQVQAEYQTAIIQECIPLEGTIYGVEALFNKDSKPRAVFVHKRIRQYPITGGQSTMRESVSNQQVERMGLSLLKKLGWYGVAMVEFKIDPRDNKPKLMEINPRFWGSIDLSIASGVDFPYLLYQMETEGDIKTVSGYKTGVKSRQLLTGDIHYLMSALKEDYSYLGLKKRPAAEVLIDFMRFWEKDLHYDLFSFDDPKPTLSEIKRIITRRLGRNSTPGASTL
jgi:predicted ATP-grasp superfamily ATP-dependent carboligase